MPTSHNGECVCVVKCDVNLKFNSVNPVHIDQSQHLCMHISIRTNFYVAQKLRTLIKLFNGPLNLWQSHTQILDLVHCDSVFIYWFDYNIICQLLADQCAMQNDSWPPKIGKKTWTFFFIYVEIWLHKYSQRS